jgi:UDP-N-acetylglucosamine acyltransferase
MRPEFRREPRESILSPNDQFHGRSALKLGEVHPTAIVHPDAKLGRGVIIGPYSVIGPDVSIGDDTEIGSHVVLENRVVMGARNRIFHGAVIGTAPQDLKYEGADTTVFLGDDNTIREFATINIATEVGEVTRVGSSCLLMAYSHVAHNCHLGDNVIMANSVNLAGHVRVDDFAILGGMTAVHQFVSIGAHSFIGGLSRISKDVPPFVKVAGIPPLPAGVNSIGLERRGFTPEQIAHAKDAYRLLYRRGLRREEALEQILEGGRDLVSEIFEEFFARATRGIVR